MKAKMLTRADTTAKLRELARLAQSHENDFDVTELFACEMALEERRQQEHAEIAALMLSKGQGQ